MTEPSDMELVREYTATRSDAAFTALVTRHLNLVYSTAVRQSGDPQQAEEVTQAVFLILAEKAHRLAAATILPGWLYQTTCFAAANARRAALRRQRREAEAQSQYM